MADDFNSARLTFPSTSSNSLGKLIDASYNEGGADVDLTTTTMSVHQGRPGIKTQELMCTVLGHGSTAVTQGSTGTVRVIFGTTTSNDGIWTISGVYVSEKAMSGSLDDRVTTAYTFRPRKS